MVDLLLVVVLDFLFDRKAMRFVVAGDHVQQVSLEASEIVHIGSVFYQDIRVSRAKVSELLERAPSA